MVRSPLVVGVVLLAASGCGGRAPDESRLPLQGDCVAPLTWNDLTYWSAGELEEPISAGERLGRGMVRCRGEGAPPGRSANVLEIDGLKPSVAVAIEGEPRAWLAPGYLPESPSHPLHDAIYGSPRQPSAEAGFRCEPSRTIRVRALTTPAFDVIPLEVEAEDEQVQAFLLRQDVDGIVTVDASTLVVGFERDGIPFVRAGDEFLLVLRECTGKPTEAGLAGLRRLVVERLSR
jgi:hypothetical protein